MTTPRLILKNINPEKFGLPYKVEKNLIRVIEVSREHEWKITGLHTNNYIVNLEKETEDGIVKMNIYLSTMTVQTALDHPKKGKTQMNRKHVDDELLVKIMENPRVHTKKGYQYKSWKI